MDIIIIVIFLTLSLKYENNFVWICICKSQYFHLTVLLGVFLTLVNEMQMLIFFLVKKSFLLDYHFKLILSFWFFSLFRNKFDQYIDLCFCSSHVLFLFENFNHFANVFYFLQLVIYNTDSLSLDVDSEL